MKPTLRTLALTGIVAAAAMAGQAKAQAQVGIAVQVGPQGYYYDAYAPPCPGPDFYWTPGYYAGSYWVPGRWAHREHYAYDRDDHYYHRDYDRHDYDRHYRDYDRHDFDHRGWDHGRR